MAIEAIIEAMRRAALLLIEALDTGQRRRLLLPLAATERRDWHYTPRRRNGVPLSEMGRKATDAGHRLLELLMGPEAHARARDIMMLEEELQRLGESPTLRDPTNYAFAIYGEPSADAAWAWRCEGHHLSVHATIAPPDGLAVTPAFMGANPAEVRIGPRRGLRVLAAEEDLARELLLGLEPEDRVLAVIREVAPADIITGPGRETSIMEPAGVPLARLDDRRREAALALARRYLSRVDEPIRELQWRRLLEAGVERLHFAWAGPLEPGRGHYYRLHGPVSLLEYDNTQNDANHIHSVWHDLVDGFGDDLLRRHHAEHHGHGHGGHRHR